MLIPAHPYQDRAGVRGGPNALSLPLCIPHSVSAHSSPTTPSFPISQTGAVTDNIPRRDANVRPRMQQSIQSSSSLTHSLVLGHLINGFWIA